MAAMTRHLRYFGGLYAALILSALAIWVLAEGVVHGRVRAFGIARDFITLADDPVQFCLILLGAVAALCVFAAIAWSVVAFERRLKTRQR